MGNGMRISPVRTNLSIEAGASQQTSVYVQNMTQEPAVLRAIINDFTALGEDGKPGIMLEEDEYAPNRSLKRYIEPIGNITVQPGERLEVPVTITIPETAQPGGYYGAVRFAPAELDGGNSNVTVATSLASLLLVEVPGDMRQDLQVETFEVRQNDEVKKYFRDGNGINLIVRFKNNGDVHEEPFGKVVLKKNGSVVGEYEVNDGEPRGNVLPESVRRFDIGLDKVSGLGKYTVEGNLGYGDGQLINVSQEFYVIPQWVIVAGIGGIVGLILLVAAIVFGIKANNRRVLRRAGYRA